MRTRAANDCLGRASAAPTTLIMVSGRPMDITAARTAGQPNARQQYNQTTWRRRRVRRTPAIDRALVAASGRSSAARPLTSLSKFTATELSCTSR